MRIYLKSRYEGEVRAGKGIRRVMYEPGPDGQRFCIEVDEDERLVLVQLGMMAESQDPQPSSPPELEEESEENAEPEEEKPNLSDEAAAGTLVPLDMPPSYYCEIHKCKHRYGSALYFACFDKRKTE